MLSIVCLIKNIYYVKNKILIIFKTSVLSLYIHFFQYHRFNYNIIEYVT